MIVVSAVAYLEFSILKHFLGSFLSLSSLMAKTIESSCRLVKKGCTQIHKALPLLWGLAEGICRQHFFFFFENLILRLELVTCHFGWKAFAIASRLEPLV